MCFTEESTDRIDPVRPVSLCFVWTEFIYLLIYFVGAGEGCVCLFSGGMYMCLCLWSFSPAKSELSRETKRQLYNIIMTMFFWRAATAKLWSSSFANLYYRDLIERFDKLATTKFSSSIRPLIRESQQQSYIKNDSYILHKSNIWEIFLCSPST